MLPNPEILKKIQASSIPEGTPLIDVRSPESFSESTIDGALNHCVYEIAFVDNIKKAFPDPQTQLVVFGENESYRGADYAFAKLTDAGYTKVSILSGGLLEWRSSSGNSSVPDPSSEWDLPEGTFKIDPETSKVRWTGRNLGNQHRGWVEVESGELKIGPDGKPVSGYVVVNMKGIECTDLDENQGKSMLIQHLESSDFFETSSYPTARFDMTYAEPVTGSVPGRPNFTVTGSMTLKAKTHPLQFYAMIYPNKDGVGLQAQCDFNRVDWGVLYGSGSIFERLGMHLVSDLISLQIQGFFKT